LTDEESDHMFSLASMASVAVFEYFAAQGTNIILNEGTFRADDEWLNFDILPRKMDDGINMQWTPKQIDDAEMKNVLDQLKGGAFTIGKDSGPKESEVQNLDNDDAELIEEEGNYMVEQLRRIP